MKKGVYKCKLCKGTGEVKKITKCVYAGINHEIIQNINCEYCKGDGYLDWIEAVVGKRKETNTTKSRVLSGFNYINKNP